MDEKTVLKAHLQKHSDVKITVEIEPKTSPIDETLSTEDQETLVSEAIDKPWKVLYEISHKIVYPKS
ncbi:MAG: hypothetical protein CBC11_009605 [Proteobacteria bacterium TMED51]|mgnify:CR=1|nr:MAG: hypothetical protein CBC11_009605 [Proteobacteria bacterium TMED51]|tara:strand:+ start:4187 stop:4387 length:201 start_codon:yes stop_codon:yes gene_type:complete